MLRDVLFSLRLCAQKTNERSKLNTTKLDRLAEDVPRLLPDGGVLVNNWRRSWGRA